MIFRRVLATGQGVRRRPSSQVAWVAAAGVILVPAVAVVMALVSQYHQDRRAAVERLTIATGGDAEVAGRLVRDQFRLLETLSVTDSLRSGDPARISALLERTHPEEDGLTGGVLWVDGTGRLRASSKRDAPTGLSYSDRDWFKAAIRGKSFVGKAVRSRAFPGEWVVRLAVPTEPGGGAAGVLAGGFLLDEGGEVVTALGGPDEKRYVVDRARRIIAGEDGTLTRLPVAARDSWPAVPTRSGSGVRTGVIDALGRWDRVVAWEAVPAAGWTAMRSVPEGRLFAAARYALVRGLLITGASVVALLVGVGWTIRRLTRRVDSVAALAERQDVLAEAMGLLGVASTRTAVANAVIGHALEALGAHAGSILLCNDDRTHLEVLDQRGYARRSHHPHSSDPTALAEEAWALRLLGRDWTRYRISAENLGGAAVLEDAAVYVSERDVAARFPRAAPTLQAQGDRAWAATPLRDGWDIFGVLAASFSSPDALDNETQYEFALLAERTAGALMRARRQELEHEAAVAMQRSVLTGRPETIPGITLDAFYHPGEAEFGVGGDWYDSVRIDDHRLVVMVGDVIGRGPHAAAAMGQLRSAAHALAPTSTPGELLDGLDAIARRNPAMLGTSVCCVLIDTDTATIEYAHAGHPPIVVVRANGTVALLEPAQRSLLGLGAGTTQSRRLGLEDLRGLVLYSDGLIERRGEDLDTCIERLIAVLANHLLSAAEIAERCSSGRSDDDTVVLRVDVAGAAARHHNLFAEHTDTGS